MANKKVGTVTHFYDKISVGIVKLSSPVSKGDTLKFKGSSTEFEQNLDDMQFNHEDIDTGKKGQEVGIKVGEKVREGDSVYKVT